MVVVLPCRGQFVRLSETRSRGKFVSGVSFSLYWGFFGCKLSGVFPPRRGQFVRLSETNVGVTFFRVSFWVQVVVCISCRVHFSLVGVTLSDFRF
jgi:hypothetical protein